MTTLDEAHATAFVLQNPLIKLWRARGLNRVFNAALPFAPAPLRDWLERERARIRDVDLKEQIRRRSRLVPEPAYRALLARGLGALLERHGPESFGDYLEFGVYNGTSLTCMYRELVSFGLDDVRLFGFDSFQGLPPDAHLEDEGRWRPGSCCSSLSFTTAVLESEGVDRSRVTLVPGWFRDTLNARTIRRHGIRKASIVMIDCDLYSAARDALEFCGPLIGDHALLLFDEYRPYGLDGKLAGERRAFDEFLADWRCFEARPFGSYIRRAEAFLVTRTR
ncbi:MAG: TylF/MycF/NovP-related O-methyltransferase [Vicinamibacterales bacterium]